MDTPVAGNVLRSALYISSAFCISRHLPDTIDIYPVTRLPTIGTALALTQ
jgi:hypothetical protein